MRHSIKRTIPTLSALFGLALVVGQQPLSGQIGGATVSGEVRTRTVFEHDLVTAGSEAMTLLRSRLGVRARLSARMGAFIQLQDARTFGEETSTLADGSADQLDLHWAYVWLEREALGQPVRIEVGRQEIVLGNERLVGAVGWSNTGRAFDAARVHVGDDDRWSLSAMAATVAERGRTASGPTPSGAGDQTLLGLSLEGATLRGDVLLDVNAVEGGATDIDRTTIAGHWRAQTENDLLLSIEGARQFGSRMLPSGRQDVRAWFLGGRVDRVMSDGPLTKVGGGIDWLSGDPSPNVGDYSAFKTLYATNHKFYGLMDLFLDPASRTGDRGLIDALLTVQAPVAETPITATAHQFWFAEGFGLASRNIGWEVDLTAPIQLEESGSLLLGYAFFRAAPGASAASLGSEGSFRHWAFAQLTIRFQ